LPSAASSTIFARNTSPCVTVYLAARERNSRHSSSLNTISNGLFVMAPSSTPSSRSLQPIVRVLLTGSTKPAPGLFRTWQAGEEIDESEAEGGAE